MKLPHSPCSWRLPPSTPCVCDSGRKRKGERKCGCVSLLRRLTAVSISILGFHYSSWSVRISPFPLLSCWCHCCAHSLHSWRIIALIQAVWSALAEWRVTILLWWNPSPQTLYFSYMGIRTIPSLPFKLDDFTCWDLDPSVALKCIEIIFFWYWKTHPHNTKNVCAGLGSLMFVFLWLK